MKKIILKECVKLAKIKFDKHPSDDTPYKHFSFIIVNNKIISIGYNQKEKIYTRKDFKKFGYRAGVHSENDAFEKALNKISNKKFEMVNIRLSRNGQKLKLSRPCNCCMNFLKLFGCSKIFYSTSDETFNVIKINNSEEN